MTDDEVLMAIANFQNPPPVKRIIVRGPVKVAFD